MTDQYKMNGHPKMLKSLTKDVQVVYSYLEARAGAMYPAVLVNQLQYYLMEFLCKPVTMRQVEEGREFAEATNYHKEPFNYEGWKIVVEEFGGKIPIQIMSVDEGSIIPTGNILMCIFNTDPRFGWLTNQIETLLMKTHYPYSTGFRSLINQKKIEKSFLLTSDLPEGVAKDVSKRVYIDLGYRSTKCEEQAWIGGASHLFSNFGSDTSAGTRQLAKYYNDGKFTINGVKGSISEGIPASEHSIATARGESGELDYYKSMLEDFPDGLVSIVADSYSVTRFVEDYTRRLKNDILERFKNGNSPLNRVIIRPDSLRDKEDTPLKQVLWMFKELGEIFGTTTNSKGYTVLHPCIGVMWGDGISDEEIHEILDGIVEAKYSVENFAMGQGGGLLDAGEKAARDTNRFAIKCSAQMQDGEWVDIQKNPLDASKKSKAGRLKLIEVDGKFKTVRIEEEGSNLLKTVFKNGELTNYQSLEQVRAKVQESYPIFKKNYLH